MNFKSNIGWPIALLILNFSFFLFIGIKQEEWFINSLSAFVIFLAVCLTIFYRYTHFFVSTEFFVAYGFSKSLGERKVFKKEEIGTITIEDRDNRYTSGLWKVFISLKSGEVKIFWAHFDNSTEVIKMNSYLNQNGYISSITRNSLINKDSLLK